MSAQEEIRLEDLSEGQQEVAALIGPENFRKLMEVYGGAYLYIPKTDRLERMERNERIRAEFDGYNFRELARKYDLTEITGAGTSRPAHGRPAVPVVKQKT